MANREIYPGGIYPLQGDIESTAGQNSVAVTGIQGTPVVNTPPQTGQLLVMGGDGQWHPEDPVVSGTDEVGTTPTKPPVQVAGIDGGGLVQELKTDPYGQLQVVSPTLLEALALLTSELRAMKTALIALDNTLVPRDFDATSYSDSTNSETALP